MYDFTFYNPTRIEFGEDKEEKVGEYIAEHKVKKVLLCYGSERVKKDGLFERVTNSLKENNIEYVELGGIVSNPLLSKVYEGVEIAKQNGVDGVLAVGGGSVLDSSKAIAVGAKYDGDVWDFFIAKANVAVALPVFDVMTLAATGSEMNGFAVVTNEKTKQKYSIASVVVNPKVSVLNPELTKSVPTNYLVYSASDIIAHCIEGYFIASIQPQLQSSLVEIIIKTVIRTTDLLLKEPDNYDARGEFMWAATLALNGLTTAGTYGAQSPNHTIEHAMSAIHNIAHGAGLSIVMPAWMKWYYKNNEAQFIRFAREVFGKNSALEGIEALEEWFNKIGTPTKLSQDGIDDAILEQIIENALGNIKVFGLDVNVYTKKALNEIFEYAK